MRSKRLRVSGEGLASSSAKSSGSTPRSGPASSTRSSAMPSPASSLTLKDTESPDGSLTGSEITRKARTSRWPPTSSKPNSGRTSSDCSRLDPTGVSGTSGASPSEGSTPRPPAAEARLSVSSARRNDWLYPRIFLNITVTLAQQSLLIGKCYD
ncbi:UNVERIFIED_CONTAM: hypothetical protein GTU68_011571 [Idotea baltica]|nr:hypothetical protein [Idotea baltica]